MRMKDIAIELLEEQKGRIDALLSYFGTITFEDLLHALGEYYTFDELMINIESLERYFQKEYC